MVGRLGLGVVGAESRYSSQRKISFDCTLIAHENVTTDFFYFFFLLFGVFFFFFCFILFLHRVASLSFFASETRTELHDGSTLLPHKSEKQGSVSQYYHKIT